MGISAGFQWGPNIPRGFPQADATFFRLDEDNLMTKCMGNQKKPVCVVALVAAQGDEFSQQEAVAEAAKKYRNDPVSFAWLDAPSQQGFLTALGLQVRKRRPRVCVGKSAKLRNAATTRNRHIHCTVRDRCWSWC